MDGVSDISIGKNKKSLFVLILNLLVIPVSIWLVLNNDNILLRVVSGLVLLLSTLSLYISVHRIVDLSGLNNKSYKDLVLGTISLKYKYHYTKNFVYVQIKYNNEIYIFKVKSDEKYYDELFVKDYIRYKVKGIKDE